MKKISRIENHEEVLRYIEKRNASWLGISQ